MVAPARAANAVALAVIVCRMTSVVVVELGEEHSERAASNARGSADASVPPASSRGKLDPDRGVAGQIPTTLEGVAGEQDAG
jgi:hypothetical protein